MKDLPRLGFAHFDIKVDTVFVGNGVAFINDLVFDRIDGAS